MTPELEVALAVSKECADLLCRHFERGVHTEYKGRGDIVTAADRETEDLVRRRLAEAFADDVVVGEEGAQPGESEVRGRRRWYVDPLDGTTNFTKGRDRWASSLAFVDADDEAGVGVIVRPLAAETLAAVRGGGVFRDGEPFLRDTDVATSGSLAILGPLGTGNLSGAIGPIARATLGIRVTGSTVADLADLVAGRADLYLGAGQGRWDLAAGTLLVAEAGLVVTDPGGAPFRAGGTAVFAGVPAAHAELLPAVSRAAAVASTDDPR